MAWLFKYLGKIIIMKKLVYSVLGIFAIVSFVSCSTSANESQTTDTTSVVPATTTTTTTSTANTQRPVVNIKANTDYIDLKTGKKIRLHVDTITQFIVNEVTKEPIVFYIDPSNNDTFDTKGRLVNRALIRSSDGDYTLNESMLMQKEVPMEDTIASMGNSKEKIKDDKYKYKDENIKVKIKDDKTKIKNN